MPAKSTQSSRSELAPAKVNLSLHVGPPKSNGRHDLISLVMFADDRAADSVTLDPALNAFQVTGPFADDTGPLDQNLILKARDAVLSGQPDLTPSGIHFNLDKRLPCASGIGGGSADAGAALRLLAAHYQDVTEADAQAAAPSLGGDVLACFHSKTGWMNGEGEQYDLVGRLPSLPALLVNSGVSCPTGPVFREYDREAPADLPTHPRLPVNSSRLELINLLKTQTENSLERPAIKLVPSISDVLTILSALQDARLVRMSGSGATCFALFESSQAAMEAEEKIKRDQPNWWSVATLLGED